MFADPERCRELRTEAIAHQHPAQSNGSRDRQYTLAEWPIVGSGGLVSCTAPRFLAAASVRAPQVNDNDEPI